jgi:hypothetical protein
VADAWAALGYLRLYRDQVGMRGVLAAFRRAVALEPNSGEAHHQLGTGYMWHLDTARARPELLRALELEPGRLVTYDNLMSLAVLERRATEAVRWSDSAIAVDRSHAYAYPLRAVAFALLGDTAAAMQAVATAEQLGASPQLPHPRCVVLGMLRAPSARAACAAALDSSHTPVDSALGYIGLGDLDRAVTVLETGASEGRALFARLYLAEPYLDPLRSDPRYRRLVESLRPAEAGQP